MLALALTLAIVQTHRTQSQTRAHFHIDTRSRLHHCAFATKPHVELAKLQFPHRANENSACRSIKNTLPRQIPMAHAYRLTADGCGRLRTVADGCGRLRAVEQLLARTASHPQTPTYKNGSPSLRIRETPTTNHRAAKGQLTTNSSTTTQPT